MKVNVHIEHLVLDGVPVGDRRRVGAAVRAELSRLLAEQGVPAGLAQGGDIAGLGGSVHLDGGSSDQVLGTRVARAVDRGWRK